MTMPMTPPSHAEPLVSGPMMAKRWRQWIQDLLLEGHKAFVPPKGIVPCNLSAADVAAEFDATGLGRRGGPYQWWAICNGSNDTPDLSGLFVRHSNSGAGATGGSGTSGAATGNTGLTAPVTGVPSASEEVQSGTGTFVAHRTHTHTVGLHLHSLGSHTHTIDPPRYDLVYLMRLAA